MSSVLSEKRDTDDDTTMAFPSSAFTTSRSMSLYCTAPDKRPKDELYPICHLPVTILPQRVLTERTLRAMM